MRSRLFRSRRRRPDRLSQLLNDDGVVLDTVEQAEVVQALEAAHATQSLLWRLALGALGLGLGCMLVWFGVSQARRPWVGYRHHSVFHRTAPAWLVALAEVLSGASVLVSTASLCGRLVMRAAARLRHSNGRDGGPYTGVVAERYWQREGHLAWLARNMAIGMTVFWAWQLCASLQAFRVTSGQALKLLWLPLAPITYAGLVVVVLRMLRSTEADIFALRRQMYVFQKA